MAGGCRAVDRHSSPARPQHVDGFADGVQVSHVGNLRTVLSTEWQYPSRTVDIRGATVPRTMDEMWHPPQHYVADCFANDGS